MFLTFFFRWGESPCLKGSCRSLMLWIIWLTHKCVVRTYTHDAGETLGLVVTVITYVLHTARLNFVWIHTICTYTNSIHNIRHITYLLQFNTSQGLGPSTSHRGHLVRRYSQMKNMGCQEWSGIRFVTLAMLATFAITKVTKSLWRPGKI